MNTTALLGPGGIIFMGIYLTSLIVVGLAGTIRTARGFDG